METKHEIITHYPCLAPELAACETVAHASSTGASMLAGGQLLSILSVATALLILGSGICALFLGLRALWGMPAALSQTIGVRLAVRRWPAAPGTIIGAEVRVTPESGEEPFYDAVVRYAYTVQGQEYEGAQDDLTYVSNAQDAALAIVARYPVGAAVPVYYDPQAPQRALIDRGIRPHHLVSLLFASLFHPLLVAGGLLAILTGLAMLALAASGPLPRG